jgi:hypothetical protein
MSGETYTCVHIMIAVWDHVLLLICSCVTIRKICPGPGLLSAKVVRPQISLDEFLADRGWLS